MVKVVILSNYGGRLLDMVLLVVYMLLECKKYCLEVFDIIEIWVDGGIRRGMDVVKVLCLGVKVVGVGRVVFYGLGVGGWKGVERIFESEFVFIVVDFLVVRVLI